MGASRLILMCPSRGRVVAVPRPVAVGTDGRGRLVATFAIERFGDYQLAVER